MKVLILKPSSLGDIVHALPVLRLIKRHRPDAQAWWWVDPRFAPLLEGDPDLAGIFLFERKRWGRPRYWPEMMRSLRALRAERFDWVIDLQGLARSGAFAWLSRGRLLAGLDEPREGARGLYDLIAPRPLWRTHAVDWYLGVLPLLGVPVQRDFDWLPVRAEVAASVREKWNPGEAPWIALLPGARWNNKRWPLEHFAAVMREAAARRPDVRFAVLGGQEDGPAGAALTAALPGRVTDLTGRTSLPEMVEWLRLCAAAVTNDTGPMHVAAALGRPVVAMFGPTEPARTGPYGQISEVLRAPGLACVPCMKSVCRHRPELECLTSVSPTAVLNRLLACLQPA